jgi:hypothetical protein
MTGDGCVAIASDLRFGVQNQTNACDMPKVFKVHDQLFVGLAGLASDMQTLCVHFSLAAAAVTPRGEAEQAHHGTRRDLTAPSLPHTPCADTPTSSSGTTCTSSARSGI